MLSATKTRFNIPYNSEQAMKTYLKNLINRRITYNYTMITKENSNTKMIQIMQNNKKYNINLVSTKIECIYMRLFLHIRNIYLQILPTMKTT